MNSLGALFAPAALLLPLAAGGIAAPARLSPEEAQAQPLGPDISGQHPWRIFLQSYRQSPAAQVRIEQRVVVRIAPRESAAVPVPLLRSETHYEERAMGSCVDLDSIVGVQPAPDNRLILFLDDRRIVSARLERACSAKDFYSGFYVERNKDGQICANRDKLQSRSGANCEVARLRKLVEVRE